MQLSFGTKDSPATGKCRIESVGKRRDGGTRYWCLEHRADATAKYGKRGPRCRYADVAAVPASETIGISIDEYAGGVALWGAVPPVYDTTSRPMDRGIHVHARLVPDGVKAIDATFRVVNLARGPQQFAISEQDAIYFMVSAVLGLSPRYVTCTSCCHAHLDRDWFCLHPHHRHLCAGCGRYFRDDAKAVGNPIAGIRSALNVEARCARPAGKCLSIKQSDFPGGLQLWGSNPAILWTGSNPEADGIHVHAFASEAASLPEIDETFAEVVIDGIALDATAVRTFMAQLALPHLEGRIAYFRCRPCRRESFDTGVAAFEPRTSHDCDRCGRSVTAENTRLRKLLANPMVSTVARLAQHAPRSPRLHRLGLLPETP